MQRLLMKHYEVVHVSDGEACLSALDSETFELILMDINLGSGKMDGIETCTVKSNPKTNKIVVINYIHALSDTKNAFWEGLMPICKALNVASQYLNQYLC
jgi:CheY-like chemotaxis protein